MSSEGVWTAAAVSINAFQTLRKSHLALQMGRTGRTDEGNHMVMMSSKQYVEQVRAQDSAQLNERDLSPMILRYLVTSKSTFSSLPS